MEWCARARARDMAGWLVLGLGSWTGVLGLELGSWTGGLVQPGPCVIIIIIAFFLSGLGGDVEDSV